MVGVVTIVGLLIAGVAGAWVSARESELDPGGEDRRSPPATEAELREAVDEISAFVERERGLRFLEPVEVELAGEGEFQERLLEDFDEDVEDLQNAEVLFQALGLIDPDLDLVEAIRELQGIGVVGFYDTETAELVVRGTSVTPYVRTIIAHELTHALDDQHFQLYRPEYDDADDEIGLGFLAVIEGNARRVEEAYRASLSPEEREEAAREELAFVRDADLGDVPLALLELSAAPYGLGEAFVVDLLDADGQAELDAAFDAPPRTSEQVMDPEAYRAGEARVEVPPPTVAGEVVEDGVAGQLLIQLVLAGEISAARAAEAATGWGGDWAVAWLDGQRRCATLVVVGDDATETAELHEAFEAWAGERVDAGAHAEVTAGAGLADPVTVEACA